MQTGTCLHLIEPTPIDDDLCHELALIEDLGFAARFVLTSAHTMYESGEAVCVVKRKIVLPYVAIPHSISMARGFMARRQDRRMLQVVKG